MQIIVQGSEAVLAALTGKEIFVKAALKDAVVKAGYMWERAAKYDMDPPVDTGRYRASIAHWSGGDLVSGSTAWGDTGPGAGDSVWNLREAGGNIELQVGSNVEYAPYIEMMFGIFAGAIDLVAGPVTELVRSNVFKAVMA